MSWTHVEKDLIQKMKASDTILTFYQQVTRETHQYTSNIEEREEGGTPAIIESIRAGLTFQLKNVSFLRVNKGKTYIPTKKNKLS